MNKYFCYTDGSYKESKHTGGWASIICDENGNLIDCIYQGLLHTTNNRMEVLAVLETLQYFKEPSDITIISDSQYVVNTIKEGWLEKWFYAKDYTKQNLDIWYDILNLLDFHKVTMEWTKGHSNNKFNNMADELAQFAANCLNLKEDEYFNKSKEGWKSLVSESETQWSNGADVRSENGEILYSLG